jgi:MFS family permease
LTYIIEPNPPATSELGRLAADRDDVRAVRRAEFKRGWLPLITAFIGVAMGIGALQAHVSGALFKPILHDFGWTRAQLSLGQTSFALLSMAATPFIGALVDRIGIRRVAGLSIVGCVVILFLLSRFHGDLSQFTMLMAALGLIGAGTSAVIYVALVTTWFDRMRGLAIGIAMAGSGFSAIVMPKFMIPYVAEAGWRMGYQALAIIMLATLPLVLIGARQDNVRPLAIGVEESATTGLSLRQALRGARFWRLALAMALMGMGLAGFYAHFVPLITDRGLQPAQAANAAATFGAAVFGGRLIAGYLLDRIYPPLVAAGAMFLAVIGLGTLFVDGNLQIYLVAAVIGLAFGTELDFAGYITARMFGRRAYGKIYSLQFSIFGAGGLLSPVIYGYVHDQTDSYGYAVAGSMVLLSAAIPVLLSLGSHPEEMSQQTDR